MRSKFLVAVATFAVAAGLLTASPANAQMVQTPNRPESDNAIGLLITYKSGISPIAPNGQPTGENFSGVDLENSRNLGGRLFAVDFARDLSDAQAAEALANIKSDPRVEKAEFDRFVFSASYKPRPIAAQILPQPAPVELPLILKTAITRASLTPITAADSWVSGTTPRVTINWTRPVTKYSGTLVGYRVQIYYGGSWRTLKSQTASTTLSYSTATSYLKAGTASRFRVAAITRKSGISYVGYYKYATVTPTTAPRAINSLVARNNLTSVSFSWTPYTSLRYMGGLPLTYTPTVRKADNTEVACVISANSCSVTDLTSGTQYTATLTISNDRGSVSVTKSIMFTTAPTVTTTDDTKYNLQWYLNSSENYSAKVSGAWGTESGSNNVVVAILDTGYTDHPDIDPSRIVGQYDLISDSSNSNDGNGWDADAHDPGDYILDNQNTSTNESQSSSWHGTHVMGIIGASDNATGILGVAPNVSLLPVRVLGPQGGSVSDIIAGINWASGKAVTGLPTNTHKANVINISIGGDSPMGCDSDTEAALAYAKTNGVTVVTAAGNDNGKSNLGHLAYATMSYPGNCFPTINVGATGRQGRPAYYSNFSQNINTGSAIEPIGVDISAPGGDYCQGGSSAQIYSTLNTGNTNPALSTYAYENGTSMAAPVVSGVVALMYSAKLRQNPNVTLNAAFVTSVVETLLDTATGFASQTPINCPSSRLASISNGGNYGGYGAGIVNAGAAVLGILSR